MDRVAFSFSFWQDARSEHTRRSVIDEQRSQKLNDKQPEGPEFFWLAALSLARNPDPERSAVSFSGRERAVAEFDRVGARETYPEVRTARRPAPFSSGHRREQR